MCVFRAALVELQRAGGAVSSRKNDVFSIGRGWFLLKNDDFTLEEDEFLLEKKTIFFLLTRLIYMINQGRTCTTQWLRGHGRGGRCFLFWATNDGVSC